MKTTKKDFEYFKECSEKWLEYFGLKRYRIDFEHCDIGDNYAAYKASEVGKNAVLKFTTGLDDQCIFPEDDWISRAAFHEVFHILLLRISCIAENRYSTPSELEEAEHDIIRTMENTLWKDSQ